jgi:type IV pilus biogenesis protein CpaD/CtpE
MKILPVLLLFALCGCKSLPPVTINITVPGGTNAPIALTAPDPAPPPPILRTGASPMRCPYCGGPLRP